MYIAINILFNAMPPIVRLDVTEDGLYTLSQGTHQILAKIDEPIKFHFFLSERLGREVPFYATYGRRVRELLVEIASASGGKLILREHNPKPFSKDEDMAVSFGVQGVPINQSNSLAYFGLAGTNSVDDIERIPFFQPEREKLLEYDLVRMIYALSNIELTTVGIMSSLPIMGNMAAQTEGGALVPWGIGKRLKTNFNIINLPESIDALPAEIDIMMIVHPRALSERAIYEIEQFLFRGGRAMLFIDPRSESGAPPGPTGVSTSTGSLRSLLEQWGVQVPDGRLVGDKSLALRINTGSPTQPVLTNFLVWLGVPGANMNRSDPITSQLSALNLASTGFITREDDSLLTMEPLIFSTSNSSPIAVEDVLRLGPDVRKLMDEFEPDDNTYVMAARLAGDVTTAFPDGPPPRTIEKTEQELAQNPSAAQLIESNGPINIIAVADSDLLEDRFWLRKRQFFGREIEEPIAGNADFVVNALGNLSGDNELLTLRTRGVSPRHFERVKELERQAERRLQDRERVLRNKLKETQNKMADLEGVRTIKDAESGETRMEVTLTKEQHAEIETLRRDMVSIRKELRAVQRSLREDVESLEAWLQFVNIGLLPMIISGIAIMLGIVRMARARRSYMGTRDAPVA